MHSCTNLKELCCFAFVYSLPFTTLMTSPCNTEFFLFLLFCCLQTGLWLWHKFIAAKPKKKIAIHISWQMELQTVIVKTRLKMSKFHKVCCQTDHSLRRTWVTNRYPRADLPVKGHLLSLCIETPHHHIKLGYYRLLPFRVVILHLRKYQPVTTHLNC